MDPLRSQGMAEEKQSRKALRLQLGRGEGGGTAPASPPPVRAPFQGQTSTEEGGRAKQQPRTRVVWPLSPTTTGIWGWVGLGLVVFFPQKGLI